MRPWNLTGAPGARRPRLSGPARALLAALGLAAGLACLPQHWTVVLKDCAVVSCQPGCRGATRLEGAGRLALRFLRVQFAAADRLAAAEGELERLKQQNTRLRRELAALRTAERAAMDSLTRPEGSTQLAGDEASVAEAAERLPRAEPLLRAGAIRAQVLGPQGRAFLARRQLLDVGSLSGVEPGALVLEGPALLDRGQDAQLAAGQLVLSGAGVWGRIVEVGRHVSTVCTVTEPGFRDVVQLVDPRTGGRLGEHCPRGLLEGTGESLARIRSIDVTEPVAEGDLVFSAGLSGVVAEPLLYGRVVRVDRPAGASSWEIWVQPAVPAAGPSEVLVLRTELSPARLADREVSSRR